MQVNKRLINVQDLQPAQQPQRHGRFHRRSKRRSHHASRESRRQLFSTTLPETPAQRASRSSAPPLSPQSLNLTRTTTGRGCHYYRCEIQQAASSSQTTGTASSSTLGHRKPRQLHQGLTQPSSTRNHISHHTLTHTRHRASPKGLEGRQPSAAHGFLERSQKPVPHLLVEGEKRAL